MADLAGSAMPERHRLRRNYRCPLSGSMSYAADRGTTTDWLGATHSSSVSRARVSGLFSAVSRLYLFQSGDGTSRSVSEMSMDKSHARLPSYITIYGRDVQPSSLSKTDWNQP